MQNKQVVAAFYAAINTTHALPPSAPASFQTGLAELLRAFPDIHYTLTDVVAEGDRVAVRWTWTGTHAQPFRGHAPTARSITNTGMAIFTLEHGAIASAVIETDRLGFLEAIRNEKAAISAA